MRAQGLRGIPRCVTGQKARDLRNWLMVYSYWNQVRFCSLHVPGLWLSVGHACHASLPVAMSVCLKQPKMQGGQDNVATMLLYLVDQYLAKTGVKARPLQETPGTGAHCRKTELQTALSLLNVQPQDSGLRGELLPT